jgi:N6-adenosine-specific RNA methylase IME4
MTYKVAVIDPPWKWQHWSPTDTGARMAPYGTLTMAEMTVLPMQRLLAQDAVALLWVIDSMLPHAMRCVDAWGLSFRTVGWYWTKVRPSGKEHIGLGYYTRANPEQCWIATRGAGLPRVSRSVRRWLHAPSGAHSEKPDAFYAAVETLFGDVPRVDVFARKQRPGWDAIGNEIDGRDIREVLGQLDA